MASQPIPSRFSKLPVLPCLGSPCSSLLRAEVVEAPNLTLLPPPDSPRVRTQYAKKKDGGAATDGVSRAAFNKICLEYFEEGMRKPARNGNPGSLESGLAVQRRHFLRGRWRDLAIPADVAALKALWVNMTPEQESASRALLDDFSRWKPGPAGRGGERFSRKRGSEDGDSGNEADSPDGNEAYAGSWEPQAQLSAFGIDGMDSSRQDMVGPPHRKRANTRELQMKRDIPGGRMDGPGSLELLCNVAFNSDQSHAHPLGMDHLPLLEPHGMHHEVDLAADRIVKGELPASWHQHHLDAPVDLVPPQNGDDDHEGGLLDDQRTAGRMMDHASRRIAEPHYHGHPQHQMSAMHRMGGVGVDYEHARRLDMHRHLDMYAPRHMNERHADMLMPYPPLPLPPRPLKDAWDSPVHRPYDVHVGGLPPSHSGPIDLGRMHGHRGPQVGSWHKSPRHGPEGNRKSPHHGPMRPPAAANGKSPRHAPGHAGEMRGDMPPPNGSWMKSPALRHMKAKKIPGSVASILETPPLTSCRRDMNPSEPASISLGDPALWGHTHPDQEVRGVAVSAR